MLVFDVGMLLINDSGYYLVCICCEVGICVVLLFGLCVVIIVLSVVGLFFDCFCYEGFLFVKLKGCCDVLKVIEVELCMLIFYEFIYCLLDSLEDIVVVLGEFCYVVLVCELIKIWEIIYGVFVGELLVWVKEDENCCKGEMVLIIEGYKV